MSPKYTPELHSDPHRESQSAIYQNVEELRRRWQPHKDRLAKQGHERNTVIRFHRACSWLEQVETLDILDDQRLVMQWIAFNTLYGVWNADEQAPEADIVSWKRFLDTILDLDQGNYLPGVLQKHKPLAMSLLEDEFLSKYFWQDPTPRRAGQSRKAMYEARTWYLQGKWLLILERVLERIYLLRCQLVHGAATHGSKLNRTAIRRSTAMLGHLLPAFMSIIVDHGSEEDWGLMCYPPLN